MNSDPICHKSLGPLLIASVLSACGGATNDDIRTLRAECAAGSSTACTAVGGGPGTAPTTELFTTAPSSLNLATSTPAVYAIGGGTAPYTASSSNPSVVQANVTGTTLTLTRLAPGPATITIVDMAGKSIKITVTSPALFSTAPSTLTLPASGSASFGVDGGTGSYTATSSNPNIMAASITGTTLTIARVASGPAEVVIFDSQGESVRIVVNAPTLFSSAPSSVRLAKGDSATYTVGGGTGQYTATSSNPHALQVSMNGSNVTVKRLELGTAQVGIIDNQGNSLQFQVTSPELFTTAPDSVTLQRNGAATYSIGGGSGQYVATSSNTSVLQASVTGSNLTLAARTTGSAEVSIVDSTGRSIGFSVTVDAAVAGDIPPSVSPASIMLSDCETNVPMIFNGTGPFSVYSSDNMRAPVSSPRQIDSTTYFFLLSTNLTGYVPPNPIKYDNPYEVDLTVLDAKSRTAVSHLKIGSQRGVCPSNPLLVVDVPSANARVTEILRFRISGGAGDYTAVSSNPSIAAPGPLNADGASFDVTAIAPGSALITIRSGDGQHSSSVIRVYPR